MRFSLLFAFLILACNLNSQELIYNWSANFGGAGDDRVRGTVFDQDGNILLAGFFEEDFLFDGTSYTTASGATDGFFIKLSPTGEPIWFKQFPSSSFDDCTIYDIAVDQDNNYYIAGSINGEVDLDPSTSEFILKSSAAHDILIGKYDSDLNLIWAKTIGGGDWDRVLDMDLDNNGDIYLTGYFGATVDFDPGPGVQNVTGDVEDDIFALKLDTNGGFKWVWAVPTKGPRDGGNSIKVKGDHVYIVGDFKDQASFPNGGSGITLDAGDAFSSFVSKHKKSGELVWLKSFEGGGENQARAVAIDSKNNVIISGDFDGLVDFDPNSGTTQEDGFLQPYLLKLSESGGFMWVYTNLAYKGEEVLVDSKDDIYQYGTMYGSVDFDPGVNEFLLGDSGRDGYVIKLNSNGTFLTGIAQESQDGELYAQKMIFDQNENIIITGEFYDDLSLGDNTLMSNAGSDDIFISKINIDPTSSTAHFNDQIGLSFFPNPASAFLNINFNDKQEHIDLALYSIDGLKILSESHENISEIKLAVHTLSGPYYISLTNQSGISSNIKILIQK